MLVCEFQMKKKTKKGKTTSKETKRLEQKKNRQKTMKLESFDIPAFEKSCVPCVSNVQNCGLHENVVKQDCGTALVTPAVRILTAPWQALLPIQVISQGGPKPWTLRSEQI